MAENWRVGSQGVCLVGSGVSFVSLPYCCPGHGRRVRQVSDKKRRARVCAGEPCSRHGHWAFGFSYAYRAARVTFMLAGNWHFLESNAYTGDGGLQCFFLQFFFSSVSKEVDKRDKLRPQNDETTMHGRVH